MYLVFAVVECNFLSGYFRHDAVMDCKDTFLKARILE